jgi:hypothetical protein
MTMASNQDELRKEYSRMAGRRAKFQHLVNQEQAKWNGGGEKPTGLMEAERHRDAADIDLAKVADKIRP